MLLIDGTFSFATPFCACIFNKHSNALHFILEPGMHLKLTRTKEEVVDSDELTIGELETVRR